MNINMEYQRQARLILLMVAIAFLTLITLTTWGGGSHVHGNVGHLPGDPDGSTPEPTEAPTPSPTLEPKMTLPYTTTSGVTPTITISETGVTYNFSTYIVSDGNENKLYEYKYIKEGDVLEGGEVAEDNEMQLLRTIDVNGLPDVESGDRLEDISWAMGKYALLISDTIHVVTLPPIDENDDTIALIALDASNEQYQIEVNTTVTEAGRTRDVRLTSVAYSLFHSGGNAEFFYVGSSDAEPGQEEYIPAFGKKVYIFEIRKLQNQSDPIQFDPLVFEPNSAMWTVDAIYNPPYSPNLYVVSQYCEHIVVVEPHGAGYNNGYKIEYEMDIGDMPGKPVGLYMPYDFALDDSTEMIIIDDTGEIAIFDGLPDLQDGRLHWYQ